MNLIIFLLLAVAAVFGGYYLLIHIIQLFTGCDKNEATLKIQRFFNGTKQEKIGNNESLFNDVQQAIKDILGDTRYKKLVGLNSPYNDKPLLYCDESGIVPCFIISVVFENENEKQRIENNVINVLKFYFGMYGYLEPYIVEWKFRDDLKIPYLQIGFATNKFQKKALKAYVERKQKALINTNAPLIDESEDNLYE